MDTQLSELLVRRPLKDYKNVLLTQFSGQFERKIPAKNSGKVCRYAVGYKYNGIQVNWSLMAWIDDVRIAKSHGLVDLAIVREDQLISFLDAMAKATLQHAFFPKLNLRKAHSRVRADASPS